jgi:predicted dehydrogenase
MSPKRYRILFVGAGLIGRRHVAAFIATRRVDAGVCEPCADGRTAVEQAYPILGSFARLEEALQHAWDAAVIATPAHTHVAIGKKLTERGIPVLLEKPVAVICDGLEDWLGTLEARPVPVMVGYVYRCHPLLVAIRDEVQAGRIGRPLQLIAQRGAPLAARRPDYARTYYAQTEQGGGVVQDILSHLYNAAEWLVGPMDRVAADAAHLVLPDVAVEDTVHAIARHGPVLATYSVNQHQPAALFTLTINGSHGSLRADFQDNRWDIAEQPDAGWTSHSVPAVNVLDWFTRQAEVFLAVIEKRRTPPCSLADGVVTLRAVLATLRAVSRHGGWVNVDSHRSSALHPV